MEVVGKLSALVVGRKASSSDPMQGHDAGMGPIPGRVVKMRCRRFTNAA